MNSEARGLPSRNWSIVAMGSAGMAAVILSYIFAFALAVGCLCLPIFLLKDLPESLEHNLFMRLLLAVFGIVAGCTILWSLLPSKDKSEVQGVRIDMATEKRLAAHIASIANALREPLPSEVYLLLDANAFVSQRGGFLGLGSRRIMGVGLPLLQMLTISQFRAVLAHEFAHYYGGDTRLGPFIYGTIRALARVYENLGEKSEVMSFLTRWAVVAAPYIVLMWVMRTYWKLFMCLTQLIARRQEYRCDELACHIAGSQPLIDGLQAIHRSSAALVSYWNAVILPVAVGGFQPQIANGFLRFMNVPGIAQATSNILAKEMEEDTTGPFDSHPALPKRIERARLYNIPTPAFPRQVDGSEPFMISEMDGIDALEGSLLRKFVPALAESELKPMSWETAASDVYIPLWRREIANYLPWLETKELSVLPDLVARPKALAKKVPTPPGEFADWERRESQALEILSCALALAMIDHGWTLFIQPGMLYLESAGNRHNPFATVAALKAGELSKEQWDSFCAEKGIGHWRLADASAVASAALPV